MSSLSSNQSLHKNVFACVSLTLLMYTSAVTAEPAVTTVAPAATTITVAPTVTTTTVAPTTTTTTTAPTVSTTVPAVTTTTTTTAPHRISSVILPINAAKEPKIALAITVPAQFKILPNPQTIPQFSMQEFIPENETGDNWTQIITTNSFINKKLAAVQFVEYLQQRFQQEATEVTVLNSTLDNYADYQRSCTTIDYHVNQRHEMVAMCYYSGPYDTAGIQYAILYPADNPPIADVAKKLEAFVDTQARVLNQEKPLGS